MCGWKSDKIYITPATGNALPQFTFKTLKGEIITNKSLKERIWLMEFWASWCKPCRVQNQQNRLMINRLSEADSTFKQHFGIIGVALDTDTTVWLKAIRNDQLEWNHQVCDTLKWEGVAALNFGLTYIPYNFLLDENGIILAQGLHGLSLEDKIRTLLTDK